MDKPTAIVTGASSGIGAATVEQLLRDGYATYACARRMDKLRALENKGAVAIELDVTRDESMRAAVDAIVEQTSRIDVLVNNAGYGSYGSVEDVPMEEARRQFDVNVFGLARLTQLVLPHMRAQRSGKILNVSSIGGKIWEPLGGWYHASKFAVEGLSDCMRLELKPFGIDVIVIQPGAIRTEWSGIARQNVLDVSGNTAYRDQAEARAALLGYSDVSNMVSKPEVVARTISKAIRARRPRTRYATGGGAKTVMFIRKVASDRVLDWLMETVTKQFAKRK